MFIKKLGNTKSLFKIANNNLTNPLKMTQVCDVFCSDIYKAKCLEALKCENPHEIVIFLDKKSGRYLCEFSGSAQECAINLPKVSEPLILLHAHPPVDGVSLPVSIQDFLIMNDSNIDKIIAYNIKGEESYLQKTSQFKPLNHKQIINLQADYMRHIVSTASEKEAEKIDALARYCIKHKGSDMVKQEIAQCLMKLQFKSSEIVDSFWRNNATKLNLEYFSDFNK